MGSQNHLESTIIETENLKLGLNYVLFNNQNISQKQVYIAHIIAACICKIALGIENCLLLNHLFFENYTQTNSKKLDDFWLFVQNQNNKEAESGNSLEVTIREFLKLAFAELGVEIEFSGKNQYEKGVIIDVDEDIATKLGLNLNVLKQGQTVVKIDANFNHLQIQHNVFLQNHLEVANGTNLQNLISLSLKNHLQKINSFIN